MDQGILPATACCDAGHEPAKTRPETELIPLDEFKQVAAAIIAVPKAEVDAMESQRPKKFVPRKPKKSS
jgi:hypothetical protein